MIEIDEYTNNLEKLNNELNLLDTKKIKCKLILIFLKDEEIEKIEKKNFLFDPIKQLGRI